VPGPSKRLEEALERDEPVRLEFGPTLEQGGPRARPASSTHREVTMTEGPPYDERDGVTSRPMPEPPPLVEDPAMRVARRFIEEQRRIGNGAVPNRNTRGPMFARRRRWRS